MVGQQRLGIFLTSIFWALSYTQPSPKFSWRAIETRVFFLVCKLWEAIRAMKLDSWPLPGLRLQLHRPCSCEIQATKSERQRSWNKHLVTDCAAHNSSFSCSSWPSESWHGGPTALHQVYIRIWAGPDLGIRGGLGINPLEPRDDCDHTCLSALELTHH